jgi:uncharacterized protein
VSKSALVLGFASAALAAAFAPAGAAERAVPAPPKGFVYDEAGWLSPAEEGRLSQLLVEWERDTSNQLIIAVFRALEGEDLATFSHRVAESWSIGQKEKDNGILLAVFAEERQIDIEVGYGLEPKVTDAIASEIIREILRPAFREGRPYDGLDAAARSLMAAASGEFQGTGRALGDRSVEDDNLILYLVFAVVLIFFIAHATRWYRAMGPVIYGPPDYGKGGRLDIPSGRLRGRGIFGRGGGGGFLGGGGFGRGGGGGFLGGGGSFGGGGARGGW